jgi:hypothetical protein
MIMNGISNSSSGDLDAAKIIEIYARKKGRRPNYIKHIIEENQMKMAAA